MGEEYSMSFEKEIQLVVLGALISLVTTLFCKMLDYHIEKSGRVAIYRKIVYNKANGKSWGFSEIEGKMNFSISMWIEIYNPKKVPVVIRDFQLKLYNKGELCCSMTQINSYKNVNCGNEMVYWGNKGGYSFVVPSENIVKYDLMYSIYKSDVNEVFDEVKISYYLGKNRRVVKKLKKIVNPWESTKTEIDEEWIKIV